MKIEKVTLTGADDTIRADALLPISEEYPFVEWGILLSSTAKGRNRFPDSEWLLKLSQLWYKNHFDTKTLKLSGHLCGRWVKQLTEGSPAFFEQENLWSMFNRIQLNFHGLPHPRDVTFPEILKEVNSPFDDFQYIFQLDNVNNKLLDDALDLGINAAGLFDCSHGAGITPEIWPDLLPNIFCGYSGGLGPDNLEEELKKIEEKVGDGIIWIDMETKLRNYDDDFDLTKCVECLNIAKKYVK